MKESKFILAGPITKCPKCEGEIVVTQVGRVFPYPHYDVYYECPNRCKGAFRIIIEPPDEELTNKFRVQTRCEMNAVSVCR